jgi:hypothetical protein
MLQATDNKCLVTITHVFAPFFVVPNIKRRDGKKMILGDFGDAPFTVVLPLQMIKPHIDSGIVRITNDGTEQQLQDISQAGESSDNVPIDDDVSTTEDVLFDVALTQLDGECCANEFDELCDDYEHSIGLSNQEQIATM